MTKKVETKEQRKARAIRFLAELLRDTASWGCTDTQYELREEFKEILGRYCPEWIFESE